MNNSTTVVPSLDPIDKGLLIELMSNCRQSYQTLARKFDLSVNAIKKRVNKLIQSGVIIEFFLKLSMTMIDADAFFTDITTDGSEDLETFIDQIGNHQLIMTVWHLANGTYGAFGEFNDTAGLSELGKYLRAINSVTNVEIHPAVKITPPGSPLHRIHTKGRKMPLTPTQLRVLHWLTKNPRMPVTELSAHTNLTPKRIRTVLNELQDGGGVQFTLRSNIPSSGDIFLQIRLHYDETQNEPQKIITWLEQEYPHEYWGSFEFAEEPTLHISMLINSLRSIHPITRTLKQAPFTKDVEILVSYPYDKKYHGLGHIQLEQLLTEARL